MFDYNKLTPEEKAEYDRTSAEYQAMCAAMDARDKREREDMLEKEKEEKEYNDNNLTNIVNDIVNESEFGTATDKMLEILKYEEKKARLMETTTYIMSELTKEKID